MSLFEIILQDQSIMDDQEESSCTVFEGYLQKEGNPKTFLASLTSYDTIKYVHDIYVTWFWKTNQVVIKLLILVFWEIAISNIETTVC